METIIHIYSPTLCGVSQYTKKKICVVLYEAKDSYLGSNARWCKTCKNVYNSEQTSPDKLLK